MAFVFLLLRLPVTICFDVWPGRTVSNKKLPFFLFFFYPRHSPLGTEAAARPGQASHSDVMLFALDSKKNFGSLALKVKGGRKEERRSGEQNALCFLSSSAAVFVSGQEIPNLRRKREREKRKKEHLRLPLDFLILDLFCFELLSTH